LATIFAWRPDQAVILEIQKKLDLSVLPARR